MVISTNFLNFHTPNDVSASLRRPVQSFSVQSLIDQIATSDAFMDEAYLFYDYLAPRSVMKHVFFFSYFYPIPNWQTFFSSYIRIQEPIYKCFIGHSLSTE